MLLPLIHTGLLALVALSPQSAPRLAVRQFRTSALTLQLVDDDLKPRFSRGDGEDGPKRAFTPDSAEGAPRPGDAGGASGPSSATELTANQQLLAEIRALQPEPVPPAPERKPVDLNGIQPYNLLIGAAAYGIFSTLAWQFTGASAQYFADHPMDSAFYVVARLSGVARVVVVGMGALGTGVSAIASVGQLALAVQVAIGIQKGELDPNKERDDPYGGRKLGELERMLGLMQGNKDAPGGPGLS